MSKEIEIELTFLASRIPTEINGVKPIAIEDVYVTKGTGSSIVRLRKKGDQYEITKKSIVDPNDHSVHEENSFSLTDEEYTKLRACSNLVISKDRYEVELEGFAAEVDVFKGRHSGLVVIDFEFTDRDSKSTFVAPDVCLVDVTHDKEISAGYLAGCSYEDLQGWLDSKGYVKLA